MDHIFSVPQRHHQCMKCVCGAFETKVAISTYIAKAESRYTRAHYMKSLYSKIANWRSRHWLTQRVENPCDLDEAAAYVIAEEEGDSVFV